MRLLCLLFPHLSIQLLRQAQPFECRPLATVMGEGDAGLISSVSAGAAAAGARVGMLAATVRARVPAVTLVADQPGRALAVLEHTALIIRKRATPRVAIGAINHLFVDLDGLAERFASEEAAAIALAALARCWTGLEVRAGVAGTRRRAFETACHARRQPLVSEESLCGPVEHIAPWRQESLPAGITLAAPGDIPGVRRRLARMLGQLQLVLDARGEGFRSAVLELETARSVETVRLRWDDPVYSLAEVFRRLATYCSDERLATAVGIRLTLERLSPDLRPQPAMPAERQAAPAVLLNPVRPVQRVLLRAG